MSEQVTAEEMAEGRVYPNLKRIKDVSFKISVDVAKYAHEQQLLGVYPIPESLEDHIKACVYSPKYNDQMQVTWSYPDNKQ